MRIKVTKTRGIYYLYYNGKIVYIGQAIFCEKRLLQHYDNKKFDEYDIREVKNGDLNTIEATEIIKYKPIYNKLVPNNKMFVSITQFLKEKEGNKMFNIEKKLMKVLSNNVKPFIFRDIFYFKRKDLEKVF